MLFFAGFARMKTEVLGIKDIVFFRKSDRCILISKVLFPKVSRA